MNYALAAAVKSTKNAAARKSNTWQAVNIRKYACGGESHRERVKSHVFSRTILQKLRALFDLKLLQIEHQESR